MKSFIVSLLILVSGWNAFGLAVLDSQPEGPISVKTFQAIEAKSVEIFDASDSYVVRLGFELSGCKDRLAPVTYSLVPSLDSLVIVVSALEVKLSDSDQVKCAAINYQKEVLRVAVSEELKNHYAKRVKVIFASPSPQMDIMTNF